MLDIAHPRFMPIALRRELLASGHTDRSIARELRIGALQRVRHGAYVDDRRWPTLDRVDQYAVRSRAAARQASASVVISHTSALALLDVPVWGLPLEDAHLTRPDGRSGRHEAGVRQHGGRLLDGDIALVHGIEVTVPARAVLESATLGSVESALVAMNDALHRGLCTYSELTEHYHGRVERWPGALGIQLALRLADPAVESVGESRTAYFLWRGGFPRPIAQHPVYDRGVLVARLDFALPEWGVWIEFDGRVKYEGLVPAGERAADVVVREKRREERIAEITGWRCLRVDWNDLANPQRLAARLRQLIANVGARRTA